MHNTQEHRESIKEQKIQFANDFIDAINKQNIDMCIDLTLSFSEYKKIYSHSPFSQEKYESLISEQWKKFFNKYQYFFDDNKKVLQNKGIANCTIYDLGEEEKISDDFYRLSIEYVLLKMKGETLDDGKISSLVFEIDNPVVINGKIKFSYQINILVYEAIEENPNIVKNHIKLGFKPLSSEQYLEIMKDYPFEDYKYYTNLQWFIYEGNLNISTDEFDLMDEYIGLIINGNLIVDDVLNIEDKALYVLGDITAKSIFIRGSICYIDKIANFNDVLVVHLSDGQPVYINDTKGRLVYSNQDAAEITVDKKNVEVFDDRSYCMGFGDITALLDDRFIEIEEDYIGVETCKLLEALQNGENIYK